MGIHQPQMRVSWLCLLWYSISTALATAAPARVAVVGGGIGGTVAAYFLRKQNPTMHIELFERHQRIGGRVEEITVDGKVHELGASIIHGANNYMLDLAREMNLTLAEGDDTDAAFSIWDGKGFIFSQVGSTVSDLWSVAKRYGITPLRYKWLSQEAGRRFGGIYALQQQGKAFETPQQWLEELGLYNVTQQSAADYMADHLAHGLLSYGAGLFIEELAGAVNRINYNQRNSHLNALAGLVSYLPAADPQVFSIKEGNAALPQKLLQAAKLQELHVGVAVQTVAKDDSGKFLITAEPNAGQPVQYGPFDSAIIAAPLEASRLILAGLDPQPELPERSYQITTTTYVAGHLDPSYFDRAAMPAGDVFVTNGADTPFTVVASKGLIDMAAITTGEALNSEKQPCPGQVPDSEGKGPAGQTNSSEHDAPCDASDSEAGCKASPAVPGVSSTHSAHQPEGHAGSAPCSEVERVPLWKVFSEAPLSPHTLRVLFSNSTVVAVRSWAAYPSFKPPEKFAPFLLAPGLCYNNALENAASAMEVAAVAAKNCALLVEQHMSHQQTAARSVAVS